jgi:ABC-type nitrate/sulfonate/bicarbonate transport system substrate-binding protein
MTTFSFSVSTRRRDLRLGFMPLLDAAPLIMAHELGVFARFGLDVQLQREIGWATIRERVIQGELEGAQAPAPMLWSAQLGCGCAPADVLTAFVLNRHGNAITLAQKLWNEGVRDGAGLRVHANRRRASERLTLAIPFRYSSHHLLLRRWLTAARIDPERDVRLVVVPPIQMGRRLADGLLDGYCVGEPWNSLAVHDGLGWCAGWSAGLAPGEPEKVLMVRRTFAEKYPAEHAAVVAALAEACAWCDRPEGRERMADVLAAPKYLDLPPLRLRAALTGQFDCGNQIVHSIPNFFVFHAGDANVPTVAAARSLQAQLLAAGTIAPGEHLAALPAQLFREDLYREALAEHLPSPSVVSRSLA